jgi:hypothetical protein
VREWRSWLARVWEQDALVEAIEVASPVLARRVGVDGTQRMSGPSGPLAAMWNRMAVTMAYLLLCHTKP